jgi:hypothetical protein
MWHLINLTAGKTCASLLDSDLTSFFNYLIDVEQQSPLY